MGMGMGMGIIGMGIVRGRLRRKTGVGGFGGGSEKVNGQSEEGNR